MEKLIEPYNVYGNSKIRLEIPVSSKTIGMKEFFEKLFEFRDEFYGETKSRFSQKKDIAVVDFTLQELAESTFAKYTPKDFARALQEKLNKETYQSEALIRRIKQFETNNKTVYLGYKYTESRNGATWYFAPCSNMTIEDIANLYLQIPNKLRSKTIYRRRTIYAQRQEDQIPASHPILFPFHDTGKKNLVRDILKSSNDQITMHLCHSGPDLDLDPLSLIRVFDEINISSFELHQRAKP